MRVRPVSLMSAVERRIQHLVLHPEQPVSQVMHLDDTGQELTRPPTDGVLQRRIAIYAAAQRFNLHLMRDADVPELSTES